jgi:hypothetical protein
MNALVEFVVSEPRTTNKALCEDRWYQFQGRHFDFSDWTEGNYGTSLSVQSDSDSNHLLHMPSLCTLTLYQFTPFLAVILYITR